MLWSIRYTKHFFKNFFDWAGSLMIYALKNLSPKDLLFSRILWCNQAKYVWGQAYHILVSYLIVVKHWSRWHQKFFAQHWIIIFLALTYFFWLFYRIDLWLAQNNSIVTLGLTNVQHLFAKGFFWPTLTSNPRNAYALVRGPSLSKSG